MLKKVVDSSTQSIMLVMMVALHLLKNSSMKNVQEIKIWDGKTHKNLEPSIEVGVVSSSYILNEANRKK